MQEMIISVRIQAHGQDLILKQSYETEPELQRRRNKNYKKKELKMKDKKMRIKERKKKLEENNNGKEIRMRESRIDFIHSFIDKTLHLIFVHIYSQSNRVTTNSATNHT